MIRIKMRNKKLKKISALFEHSKGISEENLDNIKYFSSDRKNFLGTGSKMVPLLK